MKQSLHPQHTSVVIVGGSLVGLSAALFLAWRGVKCILVEKHAASAAHPRAMGFTERTIEHFRAAGIADQIPQVSAGSRLRRVKADSLAGQWHAESSWTPGAETAPAAMDSPCRGAAIAQDKLEPILRTAAVDRGADLRLGTEMLGFEQLADGVKVTVRQRDSDLSYDIHADYMIACDGADSAIRQTLGITREGVGHLRTMRSVLFRCEEADALLAKGIQQFNIEQPDFKGFMTSYGDGRWVLMFDSDTDYVAAQLDRIVAQALGADYAFDILAHGRWELAGRIATAYSDRRVFLAGDAAHQLPPTRGGFGANTGIDDVYNLAWKLEWVLKGHSTEALLATYDEERRPIGWLRHQQTFARPDYAAWVDHALRDEILYSNEAMELGQVSRSAAIPGVDSALPPAATPRAWAGQPGTRAPHAWLLDGERTLSALDLFGPALTLMTADQRWINVGATLTGAGTLPLKLVGVGVDVAFPPDRPFETLFGVTATGALLVRPDGVIAWRSTAFLADADAVLTRAIRTAVAAH